MTTWIALAIGIVAIAILGLFMATFVSLHNARRAQGPAGHGKYPQGHWMNLGLLCGISIGTIPSLAGIAFDNLSSWVGVAPAIGLGIGAAIGSALEQKHKNESRPLTEEEQRTRFRMTAIGLGALALFVSLLLLEGVCLFATR